jgi:hypothetical protein
LAYDSGVQFDWRRDNPWTRQYNYLVFGMLSPITFVWTVHVRLVYKVQSCLKVKRHNGFLFISKRLLSQYVVCPCVALRLCFNLVPKFTAKYNENITISKYQGKTTILYWMLFSILN